MDASYTAKKFWTIFRPRIEKKTDSLIYQRVFSYGIFQSDMITSGINHQNQKWWLKVVINHFYHLKI